MQWLQDSAAGSEPTVPPTPAFAHDQALGARLRLLAAFAGWSAIAVGTAVLLGWLAGSETLTRILPELPAMSPNTAICFIASAAALLLARWTNAPRAARQIGKALAVAVFVGAGLILTLRLGLGAPELNHAIATWITRGGDAGLMAPATAGCFLLLSVALYAAGRRAERERHAQSQRFALAVVFAAFTVLLGYIYQIAALYRYREEGMAVHTAALFLVLGIGTLCLHPDRGFVSRFAERSVAGVLFRRMLVGGVFLLLLLGALVAAGQRAGWYSPAIQNALISAGGILILAFLVWHSTERIAAAEHARARSDERLRGQFEETKLAYAEAAAADQAKDQFLAMLSHELRTPLTPALLAARDLARDDELRPDAKESLKLIERNIELQTRLVDDLLDVTRIRSGKLHLQLAPCDIHDVLQHALKVCAADIDAKRLKVNVTLEARQHIVQGDCARLHQVFWNLLKNAVKFTAEGGSIHARSSNDGGKVRIEVQDSGIGIAPELLARVFDAFEQGTDATPKKLGGLGLGLAITKAITEAHHGTISARSDWKRRPPSLRQWLRHRWNEGSNSAKTSPEVSSILDTPLLGGSIRRPRPLAQVSQFECSLNFFWGG